MRSIVVAALGVGLAGCFADGPSVPDGDGGGETSSGSGASTSGPPAPTSGMPDGSGTIGADGTVGSETSVAGSGDSTSSDTGNGIGVDSGTEESTTSGASSETGGGESSTGGLTEPMCCETMQTLASCELDPACVVVGGKNETCMSLCSQVPLPVCNAHPACVVFSGPGNDVCVPGDGMPLDCTEN